LRSIRFDLEFGMVTQMERGIFLGGQACPCPKGEGPNHLPKLRNSDQILHGDQTRREENIYMTTNAAVTNLLVG